MIKVIKEFCPQNHFCPTKRICPVNAIKQDGFKAPTIDQDKCTDCGRCIRTCPAFRKV